MSADRNIQTQHRSSFTNDVVRGSPFQVGVRVEVVAAIDRDVHDVSGYIGMQGTVDQLDYDGGVGQTFPDDPMIVVQFDSKKMSFWKEELRWLH